MLPSDALFLTETPEIEVAVPEAAPRPETGAVGDGFFPREPQSVAECGIKATDIEALVLKFLLASAGASGRDIAQQTALPFRVISEVLLNMKLARLLLYKGEASLHDFVYELTDKGIELAHRHAQNSTYFGAAPVSFEAYAASIRPQAISRCKPQLAQLSRAFRELVLDKEVLFQVGEAVHAARGMILYGPPGNGKTSVAERVARVFDGGVWIPRAISAWGETIRLYDPSSHEALEPPKEWGAYDRRWVFIRRPTIVAGSELTLDSLEVANNPATGLSEAPLQLKSNLGVLVIDDFGRQRVDIGELVNRWVVPLEKRYDYLTLTSGRKVQVPFEQLLIFAANLDLRSIVDEAFLRRIPYKVHMADPTEEQFQEVFLQTASQMGIAGAEAQFPYLAEKHYRAAGRAMRFCHAGDLLAQVKNYCGIRDLPLRVTEKNLDAAVRGYFATL